MYADYEENFGLLNHSMQIYDRGCKDLTDPKDRYEVLNLQIAKASEYYGVTRTRKLFERAFELVEGGDRVQMGLRFAKMERKMGEIERARAIYQHLSQFCNPRQREMEEQFWQIWEKFEVYHGNQDTYGDYMRTKRTVEIRYSVAVPITSGADPSKPSLDLENIAPENAVDGQ
jgi:pre-mRNA-splicing factor SYF1